MGEVCGSVKEIRDAYRAFLENLKGRCNLKDLGVSGKIILNYILKKYSEGDRAGPISLKIKTGDVFL
jgi:hypothetical protein